MSKSIFIILLAFSLFTCINKTRRENDSWNLLGGPYEKNGEMRVWDGYWVEAYKDTVTNFHKLLFVKKHDGKLISDSLILGAINNNENFDYGTIEVYEKEDPEIVALFKIDDSLYHKNITRAWRANIKTGKFETFPVDGIRIKNMQKFLSN